MSAKADIPPSPTAREHESVRRPKAKFDADDPFALFAQWFEEAKKSEPADPHAAALATAGEDGAPDVRTVLIRSVDSRGFVFYTNTRSAKGRQMAANPAAALCFYWKSLGRQVRVRGPVGKVSPEEADDYFAARARGSQIGAWASDQSEVLASRAALEERIEQVDAKYDGEEVPRPSHWTGYRLAPRALEFWAEGPYRLHDRMLFAREEGAWNRTRLYP